MSLYVGFVKPGWFWLLLGIVRKDSVGVIKGIIIGSEKDFGVEVGERFVVIFGGNNLFFYLKIEKKAIHLPNNE